MAEGYYDIDDLLDYDSTLAVALGNMVVAWARAETILVFAFSAICGIKTDMATLGYYRIPSFEARVKVLRAMISEWQTTKYDKNAIDRAIVGLNRLAASRNDWIHGVWSVNRESKQIVIFDFRRPEGDERRRKSVKSADVIQHVKAVRTRTKELRTLLPGLPLPSKFL